MDESDALNECFEMTNVAFDERLLDVTNVYTGRRKIKRALVGEYWFCWGVFLRNKNKS